MRPMGKEKRVYERKKNRKEKIPRPVARRENRLK
jgi:hypothetical protein